jgi:hypothetical protein
MKTLLSLILLASALCAQAATYPLPTTPQPGAQGFTTTVAGNDTTTACLMACDGTTTFTGSVHLTTATTVLTVPITEGAQTTCSLTMAWGPGAARAYLGSFTSKDIFQLINPAWTPAQCALARANILAALATAGFTQAQVQQAAGAVTAAIQTTSAAFAAQAQAQAQAALQAQLAALQQQQPITH